MQHWIHIVPVCQRSPDPAANFIPPLQGTWSSRAPNSLPLHTTRARPRAGKPTGGVSAPPNKIPLGIRRAINDAFWTGQLRGTPDEIEAIRQFIRSEGAAWMKCRQELIAFEPQSEQQDAAEGHEKEQHEEKEENNEWGRVLDSYWIGPDSMIIGGLERGAQPVFKFK